MTAQEISDRLSQLADGLLFPSESEYPLEPFVWESTTLSSENILERSLQPSDTTIEAIALEDFFAPVVVYIVGAIDPDLVGLKTTVIET